MLKRHAPSRRTAGGRLTLPLQPASNVASPNAKRLKQAAATPERASAKNRDAPRGDSTPSRSRSLSPSAIASFLGRLSARSPVTAATKRRVSTVDSAGDASSSSSSSAGLDEIVDPTAQQANGRHRWYHDEPARVTATAVPGQPGSSLEREVGKGRRAVVTTMAPRSRGARTTRGSAGTNTIHSAKAARNGVTAKAARNGVIAPSTRIVKHRPESSRHVAEIDWRVRPSGPARKRAADKDGGGSGGSGGRWSSVDDDSAPEGEEEKERQTGTCHGKHSRVRSHSSRQGSITSTRPARGRGRGRPPLKEAASPSKTAVATSASASATETRARARTGSSDKASPAAAVAAAGVRARAGSSGKASPAAAETAAAAVATTGGSRPEKSQSCIKKAQTTTAVVASTKPSVRVAGARGGDHDRRGRVARNSAAGNDENQLVATVAAAAATATKKARNTTVQAKRSSGKRSTEGSPSVARAVGKGRPDRSEGGGRGREAEEVLPPCPFPGHENVSWACHACGGAKHHLTSRFAMEPLKRAHGFKARELERSCVLLLLFTLTS